MHFQNKTEEQTKRKVENVKQDRLNAIMEQQNIFAQTVRYGVDTETPPRTP